MSSHEESLSIEEIMKIASSPAGQKLLQSLQQTKSNEIQKAVEKASAGDFHSAKQAISSLMQDPKVKAFLSQLGR